MLQQVWRVRAPPYRAWRAHELLHERRERPAEERGELALLQVRERRAELEQRAAVRAEQRAVGAEGGQSFVQRTDELRARMKLEPDGLGEFGAEEVVLDHLRRHAHERERVLVKATGFAAHIERTERAAVGIGNRRA